MSVYAMRDSRSEMQLRPEDRRQKMRQEREAARMDAREARLLSEGTTSQGAYGWSVRRSISLRANA